MDGCQVRVLKQAHEVASVASASLPALVNNGGPTSKPGGPTSKPWSTSKWWNIELRPAAGATRGPGQLLFSEEEGKLSRELSEYGRTPHSALPRGRQHLHAAGDGVEVLLST
jgi:hypothetical protein